MARRVLGRPTAPSDPVRDLGYVLLLVPLSAVWAAAVGLVVLTPCLFIVTVLIGEQLALGSLGSIVFDSPVKQLAGTLVGLGCSSCWRRRSIGWAGCAPSWRCA